MSNEQTLNIFNRYQMSNLKDQILHPENVLDAYRKTRLGDGKLKASAARFHQDQYFNLEQLLLELDTGSYVVSGYDCFKVHEPKERVIHAPKYRDKIVQHMLNNVLAPLFKQTYIDDSYACIEGRGNLRAVRRLQEQLRQASREYGPNPTLVKADVLKFFYTIDRLTLKSIIAKYILCPWTLALLFTVIDSSPGLLGLPLGNLTSQLFANILMNELDQFAKRTLGIRYYLRYADDVFVVAPDRWVGHEWLREIKWQTQQGLHLNMHPLKSGFKTYTHVQGLDGLGFKVRLNNIQLSGQSKAKVKRYLNKIQKKEDIVFHCREIEQSVNGWLTHARIGHCERFVQFLLGKYPTLLSLRENGCFALRSYVATV